jgi:hypothetical protein
LKKCLGRNDIENALQKLDTLTQDEARMAAAQGLVAIEAVNNGVQDIGHKIDVIINGVQVFSTSASSPYKHFIWLGGTDMRGAMGEQKCL